MRSPRTSPRCVRQQASSQPAAPSFHLYKQDGFKGYVVVGSRRSAVVLPDAITVRNRRRKKELCVHGQRARIGGIRSAKRVVHSFRNGRRVRQHRCDRDCRHRAHRVRHSEKLGASRSRGEAIWGGRPTPARIKAVIIGISCRTGDPCSERPPNGCQFAVNVRPRQHHTISLHYLNQIVWSPRTGNRQRWLGGIQPRFRYQQAISDQHRARDRRTASCCSTAGAGSRNRERWRLNQGQQSGRQLLGMARDAGHYTMAISSAGVSTTAARGIVRMAGAITDQ